MTPHADAAQPRNSAGARWQHRATLFFSRRSRSWRWFRANPNPAMNSAAYQRRQELLRPGQGEKAVTVLQQALRWPIAPRRPPQSCQRVAARQSTDNALQQTQEVLDVDLNSAAAHYLKGCSLLRLGKFEPRSRSCRRPRTSTARSTPSLSIRRAHQQLGQFEAPSAISGDRPVRDESPRRLFTPWHRPSDAPVKREANQALAQHEKIRAGKRACLRTSRPSSAASIRKSRSLHTEQPIPPA